MDVEGRVCEGFARNRHPELSERRLLLKSDHHQLIRRLPGHIFSVANNPKVRPSTTPPGRSRVTRQGCSPSPRSPGEHSRIALLISVALIPGRAPHLEDLMDSLLGLHKGILVTYIVRGPEAQFTTHHPNRKFWTKTVLTAFSYSSHADSRLGTGGGFHHAGWFIASR